jgi:CheY-like chemotaxis protein
MELRALLLSQDRELIEVLQLALEDLGISAEVYSAAPWAGEDIADHRFDAVIVDFDVPTADEFLRGIRKLSGNTHSLIFAIVNRDVGLPRAFAMGANLALQKPVTVESARNSLRAAYGLIMQERRHYFRYPIETLVMISPDEHTSIVGTSTNVSEGGMAIKSERELQLNGVVKLTFSLPGVKGEIDAQALVMWKDPMGRAGIRCEKLSNTTREKLSEWLQMQATASY